MRRQVLNFVIDALGFFLMLPIVSTGFLLRWILPPGSRGGRGLELWGLTRHDWGDVHFWLALSLVALALIHVALHWSWACALVGRWLGGSSSGDSAVWVRRQWISGAAVAIACCVLVGSFLWLAAAQTAGGNASEERGRGRFRGGRGAASAWLSAPRIECLRLAGSQVVTANQRDARTCR